VRATQADLAAAIGSAREMVSRRREAWARAGLIATRRGEVRIVDRERFAALAREM
jgi:CRP/FNR family transcriptional regulator